MNFNNESFNFQQGNSTSTVVVKSFMSNVFSFMALGLGISGLIAYLFGTDASLMSLLIQQSEFGYKMTGFGWIATFSPLVLVFVISAAFERLSYGMLTLIFGLFSVMMGMSMSSIFITYTQSSIVSTFLIAAGMFGVMAIVGFTTKTDLTKFGSILMMALFGIIIATLVNFFAHSSTLYYLISFGGVIIFTGLTAYDVQKLKRIGEGSMYPGAQMNKLVILGALNLYLDFINLFLFLLRFMGNRK